MGWKIIHLTRPCKIKVLNENLLINFYDNDQRAKVTLNDIDFILFDNTQFSITGKSLELIAKNNIASLFIDEEFHPVSILTPYHQHSTMREIADLQIATPRNFKEIVWKNIVTCKIKNQAEVLKFFDKSLYAESLYKLANKVQIYDKNQNEAQAARIYWKNLFEVQNFKREQGSEDIINSMLNYSYSLLRACVARSVSVSGMLAVFGIWHKNKYNAFALADDLMEVFRPMCDLYVKLIFESKYKNDVNLHVEIKRELVSLLSLECIAINQGVSTLSDAVELFVREYKKTMMSGEVDKLFFPSINFEFFKYECL